MARLERKSLNTLADDLFETLEDWNTYLKLENIDLTDLPKPLLEAEKELSNAQEHKRKQVRRPQP